ncbi:helix-turn-helix domain-containing protein [Mucilaginibacter xinganensis]|uniref:Homeodomain-like domain-containing protein n=1 Tax=Mucilaginibacter xinganensis TaxID=1234841 RepID=A0A223P019_9SPHI|nr:hypothetical protein [Mucilaginibacter xinganensis]ASU35489.1 Homeodomain-like domain-containing protein [Mucilaginibacter xinganensis]
MRTLSNKSTPAGNSEVHFIHHGQLLEKVIRDEHKSISSIARTLKISRRTLYNWFESETMDYENLIKTGKIIGYDFSKEIPGIKEMKPKQPEKKRAHAPDKTDEDSVYYWMDKYLALLDKYRELAMKDYVDNDKYGSV